ncbi:16S rRNA (guanine(966)-N(2))-methyltransferase RsmD [Litoribrevibacter euphylliae]|uniref:Ribosomal RNA small subunit methyltransferase D n=1 Tax=Litoribrevibacter euphylliae TaxID=1834034 RepID=A0ABV7HDU8_9GAMM
MTRRRTPASKHAHKSSARNTKGPEKAVSSQLRIIGGEWRSRKLAFFPAEGLRPTLDRVRETAFNWLAPYMEGADCLDLFAGSGALTFEALSRGAKSVHINELNPQVKSTLQSQLELLRCDPARYQLTGFKGETVDESSFPMQFDILFLDPPFRKELLENCCQALEQLDIFKPQCHIYIESEIPLEQLNLPTNWKLIKQKKAGQTHYGLAERIAI